MRHLIAILLLLPVLSLANQVVLVAYYSRDGHTAALARSIAEGANSIKDTDVILKPIKRVSQQDVIKANGIILGSPVYNANPAPAVLEFMMHWPFGDKRFQNKVGAAFVTAGSTMAGQESAKFGLIRAMMIYGMVIVGNSSWRNAFGSTAINKTDKMIDQTAASGLEKASGFRLGQRVAMISKKISLTH